MPWLRRPIGHEGEFAMPYVNLLLDRDDDIAVVTVNRPKVLNALNRETMSELRQVALDLRHDEAIRSVIVTGAGEKAFVAGADIAELARLTPTDGRAYVASGQHVLELIENLGKPVIAAVNGFALGGGCELAMACTLRVAADTARFGQPEVKLGLIPGYAGTQRLARLVGRGRALDLLLTGRTIDAAEALAMGLVNRVVPPGSLLNEAKALARSITANGPLAVRYAIEAVNRGLDATLADGAFLEASLFGLALATDDAREGTAAFLEKRKPAFTGK
jgi:enoyl-CoA hydratase